MSRTETAIFTNMCMIYDNDGNVLVQERTDSNLPGIAFPGGHVEKGEPFTDAVIREILEETGLTVSNLQLCGVKDWITDSGARYLVHLYKTNQYTGHIKSSDEGDVWWAPLSDLPNMKLARSMTAMLDIFFDDSITEHFLYQENGEWIHVLK